MRMQVPPWVDAGVAAGNAAGNAASSAGTSVATTSLRGSPCQPRRCPGPRFQGLDHAHERGNARVRGLDHVLARAHGRARSQAPHPRHDGARPAGAGATGRDRSDCRSVSAPWCRCGSARGADCPAPRPGCGKVRSSCPDSGCGNGRPSASRSRRPGRRPLSSSSWKAVAPRTGPRRRHSARIPMKTGVINIRPPGTKKMMHRRCPENCQPQGSANEGRPKKCTR